jgi:hypothetical protein
MALSSNKIFGIGLSRTGTTSLTEYLNRRGIRCIHYPNTSELTNLKYDAACDITVAEQYKNLDKKYPNSKFILTIRDRQEWIESLSVYMDRPHKKNMNDWSMHVRAKVLGSAKFDWDKYLRAYDKHHADVRKYFKNRDDMIEINIVGGESPERLCNFLGIKYYGEEFAMKNKLRIKK